MLPLLPLLAGATCTVGAALPALKHKQDTNAPYGTKAPAPVRGNKPLRRRGRRMT